ncbi:MAG: hypothetical protein H7836_10795 [Magnetococcus sp. YQC-3]
MFDYSYLYDVADLGKNRDANISDTMGFVSGDFRRCKKFALEIRSEDSTLSTASRNDYISLPKIKLDVGFRRKKQLAKEWVKIFLLEGFIEDKELMDWLMYERIIRRERLLAIAGSFNRDEYEERRKGNGE